MNRRAIRPHMQPLLPTTLIICPIQIPLSPIIQNQPVLLRTLDQQQATQTRGSCRSLRRSTAASNLGWNWDADLEALGLDLPLFRICSVILLIRVRQYDAWYTISRNPRGRSSIIDWIIACELTSIFHRSFKLWHDFLFYHGLSDKRRHHLICKFN